MRLLLAGTPHVAVPSFEALASSTHEVVGVLTRPDTVAGRGRRPVRSAIADRADALGIPVHTWSPRDPRLERLLIDERIDCCPVVAYGALIPAEILAIPQHGWVNLHFSLLPAWRGAAPVQHAVMHGDALTGATTFRLDAGLDTGPILATIEEPIAPRDTSGDVLDRLARRGADLLVSTMDGLAAGTLAGVAQPGVGASYAPKIDVADARISWGETADAIDRRVRGCTPAPGAWTMFRDERVKLGPVLPTAGAGLAPGEIRAGRAEVLVGTATTTVLLGEVTAHGKRAMPAADWARGVRPADSEAFV